MERRSRNNEFVQQHIVDTNRAQIIRLTKARAEAEKDLGINQSTITAIHILFLVVFALVIKDLIIQDIDQFYTF